VVRSVLFISFACLPPVGGINSRKNQRKGRQNDPSAREAGAARRFGGPTRISPCFSNNHFILTLAAGTGIQTFGIV